MSSGLVPTCSAHSAASPSSVSSAASSRDVEPGRPHQADLVGVGLLDPAQDAHRVGALVVVEPAQHDDRHRSGGVGLAERGQPGERERRRRQLVVVAVPFGIVVGRPGRRHERLRAAQRLGVERGHQPAGVDAAVDQLERAVVGLDVLALEVGSPGLQPLMPTFGVLSLNRAFGTVPPRRRSNR
jgi:hypothetical protein